MLRGDGEPGVLSLRRSWWSSCAARQQSAVRAGDDAFIWTTQQHQQQQPRRCPVLVLSHCSLRCTLLPGHMHRLVRVRGSNSTSVFRGDFKAAQGAGNQYSPLPRQRTDPHCPLQTKFLFTVIGHLGLKMPRVEYLNTICFSDERPSASPIGLLSVKVEVLELGHNPFFCRLLTVLHWFDLLWICSMTK